MQDLVHRMDAPAASFVTPDFLKTLDRYAREQRQIHEAIERPSLPPNLLTPRRCRDVLLIRATQVALPTIDLGVSATSSAQLTSSAPL